MWPRAPCRLFLITWSNIRFRDMKPNAVMRLACHVESYHLTKLTLSRSRLVSGLQNIVDRSTTVSHPNNCTFSFSFSFFIVEWKHSLGRGDKPSTNQHQQRTQFFSTHSVHEPRLTLVTELKFLIVRVVSVSRRWTFSFSRLIWFNRAIGDFPELG